MAQDDIIGLSIIGRYQDQNISNTIHYRIADQADTENDVLTTLCVDWQTTLKIPWLAVHNAAYSLMGLKAFNVLGANKIPGIEHIDDPGTVVGDPMPSPLCRVITMYTDSDNYRRRGRIMISGGSLAEFDDEDGAVLPAAITALETLGALLLQPLSYAGNTFIPGLRGRGEMLYYPFTGMKGRKTPALISSRRVRGFSIG